MPSGIFRKADDKNVSIVIGLLDSAYPLSEALRKEIHEHIVAMDLKKGQTLIEEGLHFGYAWHAPHQRGDRCRGGLFP